MLTTRDLPEAFRAEGIVEDEVTVVRIVTLRCAHGPACPACVLDEARRIVDRDATLTGDVPRT